MVYSALTGVTSRLHGVATIGRQPPLLWHEFLQRLDNEIRLLGTQILGDGEVPIGYPDNCENCRICVR
jgi:hypothetical protein